MPLKLMYITNDPAVAQIAETAGVDRIFVDMEYIGKADRQGNLDTAKNHHTPADVAVIRSAVKKAEVLTRVNSIHDATVDYGSSEEEINSVIEAGTDLIMLPFFKTVQEVETFLRLVNGKAKTMLLVETPESVEIIDEILNLDGIDEVLIGLNDLSLGYGMPFMFELMTNGVVDDHCRKFKQHGVPFGIGGIAGLGKGDLPAEFIIRQHYKLGSTCAILSRSFCNTGKMTHMGEIAETFFNGLREIRDLEAECALHADYFADNEAEMKRRIDGIVSRLGERK